MQNTQTPQSLGMNSLDRNLTNPTSCHKPKSLAGPTKTKTMDPNIANDDDGYDEDHYINPNFDLDAMLETHQTETGPRPFSIKTSPIQPKRTPKRNLIPAKFKAKLRAKLNPEKKQQKMKHFFQKKKPEMNWQGFPLPKCTSEGDHGPLYRPVGWGQNLKDRFTKVNQPIPEINLCRNCLLRPCLMHEKYEDFRRLGDETLLSGAEPWKIYEVLDSLALKLLTGIFGKRYVKSKMKTLPCCVREHLYEWYSYEEASESEDEIEGCKWDD